MFNLHTLSWQPQQQRKNGKNNNTKGEGWESFTPVLCCSCHVTQIEVTPTTPTLRVLSRIYFEAFPVCADASRDMGLVASFLFICFISSFGRRSCKCLLCVPFSSRSDTTSLDKLCNCFFLLATGQVVFGRTTCTVEEVEFYSLFFLGRVYFIFGSRPSWIVCSRFVFLTVLGSERTEQIQPK